MPPAHSPFDGQDKTQIMVHPYAQYPYAPRQNVDPRYVGPAWAAPGPYVQHPQQPSGASPPYHGAPYAPYAPYQGAVRKNESGPLKAVLLIVCALLLVPLLLAVVLGAFAYRMAKIDREKARTKPPSDDVATIETTGRCVEVPVNERELAKYTVYPNAGSARALRGKVALIHLGLGAANGMTETRATDLDKVAILQKWFYEEQAKRYGVTDLDLHIVPWPLTEVHPLMPTVAPSSRQLLSRKDEDEIALRARHAAETALGKTLETMVTSYQAQGFTSVGFLVYAPMPGNVRSYAMPLSTKADTPEMAMVFPDERSLDAVAVTVAHESLHLFGADDVYRVKIEDDRDANDLMGESCRGFGTTVIGGMTAYAVGWSAVAPARKYESQVLGPY